jgi:ribonuclease R
LIVAIADVSHYVDPAARSTREAFESAQLGVLPGLRHADAAGDLSNGICSLNPKVDGCAWSATCASAQRREVTRSTFHEAVMRSHARLTYTRVWQAIGEKLGRTREIGKPVAALEKPACSCTRCLAKARSERGAIEFESAR